MSSDAIEAYEDVAADCGDRRFNGVNASIGISDALTFVDARGRRTGVPFLLISSTPPLGRAHVGSTVVTNGLKEAIGAY
jgi:hypothetical protein